VTTIAKLKALHLLTYGEAMSRLHMCYKSGTAIKEWQAYINCEPAFFGQCFLPSTPADYTALAARNSLMQCHLSFNQAASTHVLLFRIIDGGPATP
jgi:hypothetical protein